jgi:redox-sensitive bicupin YhaK (pirin superfamily)
VRARTGIVLSTIARRPGARLRLAGLLGRNVFLYVARGSAAIGGDTASAFHLAELSDQGDALALESEHGALLLFGHAEPIGEPVFSHGPFVMNTREEIVEAINDYQAGRFGPAI